MSLINGREILEMAERGGYAVGHFIIENMESLQAIEAAAREKNSPVIVGTSPKVIEYMGIDNAVSLVENTGSRLDVPVTLNLDHGEDLSTVRKCVENGYNNVMIDKSHLGFEENIDIVSEAVEIAHPEGVSVEAELGEMEKSEEGESEYEEKHTDPNAAQEFVERTGIDSLAVSIGNAHGAYKGEVDLDFDRLREIKGKVDVPLVLHGSSAVYPDTVKKCERFGAKLSGAKGTSDEDIKKAISAGIRKVNIGTDQHLAFTSAVREVLSEHPETYVIRNVLGPSREAMKELVMHKMEVFGSAGKA